jgi:hypothetical protein
MPLTEVTRQRSSPSLPVDAGTDGLTGVMVPLNTQAR